MAKTAINKEEGSFEIRDLLFLCARALKGRMSAKLTVPGAAGSTAMGTLGRRLLNGHIKVK